MERLKPDFGDYVSIEQHRYGAPNEIYLYKVIGRLRSNSWVDVPVIGGEKETLHENMEDVVRCICCGVSETEVLKFNLKDLKEPQNSPWGKLLATP